MVRGNLKRTREDRRRLGSESEVDVDEQIPIHRTKFSRRNDESPATVVGIVSEEDTKRAGEPVEPPSNPFSALPNDPENHIHDDIDSLLDFTSSCSQDEISSRFDSISSALLSEYYLSIVHGGSETNYEILELEFYLQKSGCHEDPFTHGSTEQERSGQWYFHRAPKRANGTQGGLATTAAGGYRGGTRKGLDLTLGGPTCTKASSSEPCTKSAVLRGGALLRTIRRCHDQKVISGPSLLVDEILRLCSVSNINELVSAKWQGGISALSAPSYPRSTYMYLRKRPASTLTTSRVFCSPRIGLDLSNTETKATPEHPRVVFVGKLYRYFTHPELLTANGRAQTFVGLYMAVVAEKNYEANSLKFRNELSKVMGIKDTTLAKYSSDYQLGLEKGKLENFVGASGKGVSASASTYLRMMGTLARMLHEAS